MIWRVRFQIIYEHVHCDLFCAKQQNMTFANCGHFVVTRGEEFASLMRAFSGAEFVGLDEDEGILAATSTQAGGQGPGSPAPDERNT